MRSSEHKKKKTRTNTPFLQLVYLSTSHLCFDWLGLVAENAISGTRVLISRFGEYKVDLTKWLFSILIL